VIVTDPDEVSFSGRLEDFSWIGNVFESPKLVAEFFDVLMTQRDVKFTNLGLDSSTAALFSSAISLSRCFE
jgi:hypothetical protein